MSTMRKFAGLIAAALLAAFGATLIFGHVPLLGILLCTVAAVAAFWQVRSLFAQREDPYDLSRLFDAPLPTDDKPEVDVAEAGDMPFCYHCGHAVAKPFARCPNCGGSVR